MQKASVSSVHLLGKVSRVRSSAGTAERPAKLTEGTEGRFLCLAAPGVLQLYATPCTRLVAKVRPTPEFPLSIKWGYYCLGEQSEEAQSLSVSILVQLTRRENRKGGLEQDKELTGRYNSQ